MKICLKQYTRMEEWYPKDSVRIILSQQVTSTSGIVAPQTSYFDYVRVKQFFLAPEITVPSLICSSGTATMDVDPLATNITWQLTPSSLFTTSNGVTHTANITRASGANGLGKITYTFNMPSGESFTADKEFWVGVPIIRNVSGPRYNQIGASATYPAIVDGINPASSYNWNLTPGIFNNYFNPGGLNCYTTWYRAGEYVLTLNAQNTCPGTSATYYYPITVSVGNYLSVIPNPASDNVQVTVMKTPNISSTLDSTSSFSTKNIMSSYQDLVKTYTIKIYNNFGTLFYSAKKAGDEFTIPVNNLKDGIYIIEANDGKESYKKQLVVRH